MSHEAVVKSIETAQPALKHVETVDKSTPAIDANVHVKKVDRGAFLSEVTADHQLKHAETSDRSAPQVGEDVHVKKIDRAAFLNEVAAKGHKE